MRKSAVFVLAVLFVLGSVSWALAEGQRVRGAFGIGKKPWKIVSAFGVIPQGEKKTLYTVPEGKTFILKDLVCHYGSGLRLYENEELKIEFEAQRGYYSFRAGIPFSAGDIICEDLTDYGNLVSVTIMGVEMRNKYLLDDDTDD